jgi:Rha family phage regulatory protein
MNQEIKDDALPALCVELGVRAVGGVPLVNSRVVVEKLGKDHRHVLRDIKGLITSPDLGALDWFRSGAYSDAKGEVRPSFDLTEQGFSLLVMGWTGSEQASPVDRHGRLNRRDRRGHLLLA